jgi:hypothetical protein
MIHRPKEYDFEYEEDTRTEEIIIISLTVMC